MRAELYMFVLRGYAACDVQLPAADVEVGRCDGYRELEGYALGCDGAGVGGLGDAAEGAGGEAIGGLD